MLFTVWDVYGESRRGFLQLANDWVNGARTISTIPSFEPDIQVTVRPRVRIGLDLVELTAQDYADLGLSGELNLVDIPLGEYDWDWLDNRIVTAIRLKGLPRLKMGPFDASLAADVSNVMEASFSLDVPASSSAELFTQLYAGAIGVNATATADWSNTLSLESITVPSDFDAMDVDGLRIEFASGLVIPVAKAVDSEIPEPSTGLLFAVLLLCRIRAGRRNRRM